jgi:peptidoglycan/LPS O-acetylase OafA/YrhL
MTPEQFRTNNFDLIRLLAAAQVVYLHAAVHLQLASDGWLSTLIAQFPGVPIFFFISGFLISRSYEINSALWEYATNRILRIYPGLWICLMVTTLAVAATGYFSQAAVPAGQLAAWLLAQSTFVQFFNPDFMRGFGVGVINGSLWTISVELQFYVLIPVLYWLLARLGTSRSRGNAALFGLILVFAGLNRLYYHFSDALSEHFLYKLAGVSFAPWIYMFLLGTLAQRNFPILHRLLAGSFVPLLAAYLGFMWLTGHWQAPPGNSIGPAPFLLLAAVVFACAYSWSELSRRLLRGNDVSYGVYIYHMPVINLLLFFGPAGRPLDRLIVFAATLFLAGLSWVMVERPALALKKHPMNPLRNLARTGRP